ncbi:MAG TPA: sigma-54 dependent transcriptional regulator [bacterium]|nr:sigma-54 dependent transcriptional regulator [bacterium]HPN43162.1 sigma-54 dependent transcriptional regulator [bacterium]
MSENPSVLVVEDDPTVRQFLEVVIKDIDCVTTSVGDGKAAINAIDNNDYDIVFTDLRIPELSGIKVLEYIKKVKPEIDVVIGTAYGSIENAVEAMRKGAFDYLTKPYSKKDIQQLIRRVLKHRNVTTVIPQTDPSDRLEISSILIGKSTQIEDIINLVNRIAPTNASILIEGETGVGKEVVADAIHLCSNCRENPYIKVNCAALPETLIESELFGYEKGAFTGAHMRRKGRFEQADGGTILLDEIGELPLSMQAKLLRVLQTKQFERLGDTKSIKVNTRVIATTNRDLREEVKEGRFRKDLYFRLNVIKINVPALRQRKGDIPLLAEYFIKKVNAEHGLIKTISEDAMKKLCDYDWPGNIRELQNTIEKVAVIALDKEIKAADLEFIDDYGDLFEYLFNSDDDLTIYEAEKRLIMKTLKKVSNNKTKAAQALGITVKTLRNKLKSYGGDFWEENSQ